MHDDMTDDELQIWLLAEGISADTILAPEDAWQAAQTFREDVRDQVAASQFERDPGDDIGDW